MAATIAVYADWAPLPDPRRVGMLRAHRGRGRDVFEFEFDAEALRDTGFANPPLDPRLGHFSGRQHPPAGRDTFGLFADASPDRWGRMLMRRRLERDQRAGRVPASARLHESDYLLGVHDQFRLGGLRFRLDDEGPFLDDRHDAAAPPFVELRALEAASLALERDESNTAREGDAWLRMLLAPGGSLGGARPKASVVSPDGALWIAKFPSVRDEHDVGGWELVVHTLALGCGLRVSEAMGRRFASGQHTFLVKRFDRTSEGRRLHVASAMTLTDHVDGDDASTGASYLELAQVLMAHGARPAADLHELWSRIVFNVCVSNVDDHLRNHAFVRMPGVGWALSEAFDMNPVAGATGHALNISEADNARSLDLALSVAPYFRVKARAARERVDAIRHVVRQWRTVATRLKIPVREQERMAPAFEAAE